MYKGKSIALIFPARNESQALPLVLKDIPQEIDHVIVVDNGSADDTAKAAHKHGASVISAPVPGYGRACLAAFETLNEIDPDIVAFADADGSDDISRLLELIDPIVSGNADLVLEQRIPSEPEAMSTQQRFGNHLATSLIHIIWGHLYNDLGPMRAIQWSSLQSLDMKDQDYGWTVEMQIKALKRGLRVHEYPLPYRKRAAGRSKVSRTLNGTVRAGFKILWVIFREALLDGRDRKIYPSISKTIK
jgi:glycosyltransferase involved in cell wall biosynthesis